MSVSSFQHVEAWHVQFLAESSRSIWLAGLYIDACTVALPLMSYVGGNFFLLRSLFVRVHQNGNPISTGAMRRGRGEDKKDQKIRDV